MSTRGGRLPWSAWLRCMEVSGAGGSGRRLGRGGECLGQPFAAPGGCQRFGLRPFACIVDPDVADAVRAQPLQALVEAAPAVGERLAIAAVAQCDHAIANVAEVPGREVERRV